MIKRPLNTLRRFAFALSASPHALRCSGNVGPIQRSPEGKRFSLTLNPDRRAVHSALANHFRKRSNEGSRCLASCRLRWWPALAAAGLGSGRQPAWRAVPSPEGGRPAHAALPLSEVWPDAADYESLFEVGRGKGVVISPDLSVPGNRRFYERLGFAYFEDADWRNVLAQIRAHNRARPERRIELLILQTHGTNGHGLKLQTGRAGRAALVYLNRCAAREPRGTGVRAA